MVTAWLLARAQPDPRWPDGPITRSPDGPMTRSPDGPMARSPDHPMARWPDHPMARWPDGSITRWPDSDGELVVAPGQEAAAIAGLPVDTLKDVHVLASSRSLSDPRATSTCLTVLRRWAVRTLGDFARLPQADVRTRLGPAGVVLHQAARGVDLAPFVPVDEPRRFVERLELDWPVEGLEPLSFVLGRITDALSLALERADRGAIGIITRLKLVTRELHIRRLQLPSALREARVLRTLILLDLESHRPPAGIDVVEIEAEVAPGRIVQGSLLAKADLSPEVGATLMARLQALAGERRVGAPALVDTHDGRVCAMAPFALDRRVTVESPPDESWPDPVLGLRRFRLPIAARVQMAKGLPVRVFPSAHGLAGGRVIAAAGPWRTSGRWWAADATTWDRELWDVEVDGSGIYRLARDRRTGRWEIEGEVD